MLSFRTQGDDTSIEVCEDLRNVCGFFDFPDDQVAIASEHAVVEAPFGAHDTKEFLGYLQKAAKNGMWALEISEEEEKENWWAYLDLIDYFNLKQPFLDQALAAFLCAHKRDACTSGGHWGTSKEPGPLCETWLDRLMDMAIRASQNRMAFPLTWSAFREAVISAATFWAENNVLDHQFFLFFNSGFEWMQLVRHPRWPELSTPDLMTAASFALVRSEKARKIEIQSEEVCTVKAVLDIPDLRYGGSYQVSLGDVFMVQVHKEKNNWRDMDGNRLEGIAIILTTQQQVGPVEVVGTIQAMLSDGVSSREDEIRLRFIYYCCEGDNPDGQMWMPYFTFGADDWFAQSIRNPSKAARIRFSFSFQLTFLPR